MKNKLKDFKKIFHKKEQEFYTITPKISVVINTYNADRLLENTINSVIKADEIIICDMHSTDKTIAIAEKYNCKIYYHEKLPQPDPARNFAISKASGDWVLILDADEIVTEDLWNKLTDYAKAPYKNYYVLNLLFRTYFLNGFLKHLEPEYHPRFFKKGHLKYGDGKIHAKPVALNSEILNLKSDAKKMDLHIYHYTYENIEHLLNKWNIYTSEEVKKVDLKKLKNCNPSILRILKHFISSFLQFFSRGAYIDGFRGFIWCLYRGIYKTSAYIKTLEAGLEWEKKQTLEVTFNKQKTLL